MRFAAGTNHLAIVVGAMLAALSCGGGGNQPAAGDALGDAAGAPGSEVAGQPDVTADSPTPDETRRGEEVAGDQGSQPQVCAPACSYKKGEYCDRENWVCKTVACWFCLKDIDCADDESCVVAEFKGGEAVNLCSSACLGDEECPPGYECHNSGLCMPEARCPDGPCGEGEMGDPCAYQEVNEACGDCSADLKCMGSDPSPSMLCQTDQDCLFEGVSPVFNPDCVKGRCGSSYCVSSCDDEFECPEGFEPYSPVLGKCYCVPVELGDSEAGEPCPIFGVHFHADYCTADLTCLGIAANPHEDPETGEVTNLCETADDCPADEYYGNPDCVDGLCGASFCAPHCDENDDCPGGFGPISVSDTCYCAPVEVGDSGPGEPCPIFGVNDDADLCQAGLVCLGIAPDEDTVMCEEAADCAFDHYPGGAVCQEGQCGSSFCAPKCTKVEGGEEEEWECEEGYETINVKGKCYCAPYQMGNGALGEACPFGNINTDAEACAEELGCTGTSAHTVGLECVTKKDCPDGYWGATACFQGYCGSSACAADCNELGECPDGSFPFLLGGGFCYCLSDDDMDWGQAAKGEACGFLNVNSTAGMCAEGLACYGVAATKKSDECDTAEGCAWNDYPGVADCVNGHCGTSFCAAGCDQNYECELGHNPVQPDEEGACHCVPEQIGSSAAGEGCPFSGEVNSDADYCQAGLTCLGISATAKTASCAIDTDCALDPYLANPDCVEGHCGTSLCTPKCNDDDECPEGWEVLILGSEEAPICYCIVSYAGEGLAGDACPYYNIHTDKDFCASELECLGIPAQDVNEECIFDNECPTDYFGPAACFNGFCGSAMCVEHCTGDLGCGADSLPWVVGGPECVCAPGFAAGEAQLGQACPYINVNLEAPTCGADLACWGIRPWVGNAACETVQECSDAGFPGVPECVAGVCASSFCSQPCGEEESCPEGFEPVAGDEACFCRPTVGEGE